MECNMPDLDVIDELRSFLPPIFVGTSVDALTGGAVRWSTLQNRDSAGELPGRMFIYSGRKKLIRRDIFLTWFATTLCEKSTIAAEQLARNSRKGHRPGNAI